MNDPTSNKAQPKNTLHGLTLEAIVRELETYYGWSELGERIPVRCFTHDPSVNSSLKFLRKTPWAREKKSKVFICSFCAKKSAMKIDQHE